MQSLVDIDQVALEKKMKMWKVYDNYMYNDDSDAIDDNDDGQRTHFDNKKLTWAFSSGDLKISFAFENKLSEKCLQKSIL